MLALPAPSAPPLWQEVADALVAYWMGSPHASSLLNRRISYWLTRHTMPAAGFLQYTLTVTLLDENGKNGPGGAQTYTGAYGVLLGLRSAAARPKLPSLLPENWADRLDEQLGSRIFTYPPPLETEETTHTFMGAEWKIAIKADLNLDPDGGYTLIPCWVETYSGLIADVTVNGNGYSAQTLSGTRNALLMALRDEFAQASKNGVLASAVSKRAYGLVQQVVPGKHHVMVTANMDGTLIVNVTLMSMNLKKHQSKLLAGLYDDPWHHGLGAFGGINEVAVGDALANLKKRFASGVAPVPPVAGAQNTEDFLCALPEYEFLADGLKEHKPVDLICLAYADVLCGVELTR